MRLCLGMLIVAAALGGCRSEPAVTLAPVRGRVTLSGKGLAAVSLQLTPDGTKGTNAPTGLGETDGDGRFQIVTPPHGEGAVPGHYKVTVSGYGGNVPKRYTDPVSSPLSVEVPHEGLDNWAIELVSQ